jgi:hypothetical protein
METIFKDIRYAVRGLRKRPGFTVVAVITLALGIGANTSIFSVVNAVILRPLRFTDPDRLAVFGRRRVLPAFQRTLLLLRTILIGKNKIDRSKTWPPRPAIVSTSPVIGDPERVAAYGVTANFFPILGVQPLLGRPFLDEEDRPGANNVRRTQLSTLANALWWRK